MNFDAQARRQAQGLLDALATHLADAARAEHDALRAAVDQRIAALQEALPHPDEGGLLERFVQDLSSAAREETDATVARARLEVERTAAAGLAAAQVEVDNLRLEWEARLEQLQNDNAAVEARFEQLQADHAAVEARFERERAARTESEARLERVQATYTDIVSRLEQASAANAGLAAALAEAQGDVATARSEAGTQTANLMQAHARVHALEQEHAQLVLARDEAGTRLEAETRRAGELAGDVEAARQQAKVATADADASREERESVLDRVGAALRSIDQASGVSDILEALIEPLGHDFARVAVFMVGPSSFRGWRGRGFGPTADITTIVKTRAGDSLMTRAVDDRKPVSAAAAAGDPLFGLSGSPVARAVALPVLASGHIVAVVYAEDGEGASTLRPSLGCKIAEMLIDHAALRLTTRRRASAPSVPADRKGHPAVPSDPDAQPEEPAVFSPARQARRVRIKEGIEVALDGAASFLVDLSAIGAQVLSSIAMRPNRLVKMTLRSGKAALACKGRVMWSRFEQPRGTAASQYRVGVKFTEVEPQAIESFLSRHEVTEEATARSSKGASAAL